MAFVHFLLTFDSSSASADGGACACSCTYHRANCEPTRPAAHDPPQRTQGGSGAKIEIGVPTQQRACTYVSGVFEPEQRTAVASGVRCYFFACLVYRGTMLNAMVATSLTTILLVVSLPPALMLVLTRVTGKRCVFPAKLQFKYEITPSTCLDTHVYA